MNSIPSQPMFGEDRKSRLHLGELPVDFLRISVLVDSQLDADQQLAMALERQQTTPVGRLNVTIDQAKLVKNYGLARMDPYAKLRIGHATYETKTNSKGGKNPRWNEIIPFLVLPGCNTINVEIFDECSFTMDELIAWAVIPIPNTVFAGQTHEEWFPLSGKQGEGKEGAINLVLSFTSGPMPYAAPAVPPVMMVPRTGGSAFGFGYPQCKAYPVYPSQIQIPPHPQPVRISAEDLKIVEEMFPNLDKDVIKSVLEANGGNREAAINSFLQMSQ